MGAYFSWPGGLKSKSRVKCLDVDTLKDVALITIVAHPSLGVSNIQELIAAARAMIGPKRSSVAPDIPAVARTLPGDQSTLWYALLAPKGTPQPILNRLHDDTIKALRSKDVVQPLESQGAEGVRNSPQET